MRQIDIQAVWKKECEAGSVEFGIWVPLEKALEVDSEWYRIPAGDMTILCDTKGHQFIGTCGLYSHRDIYRSWEFRILIFDPSAIGHGIGTEATSLVVQYAFSRLNAHRVWLGVNAENEGAIKCYQKVGFKEEGRLREELFCFGHYVDAIRMGILENEWKSASPEKA